jgi:hypothetical protein
MAKAITDKERLDWLSTAFSKTTDAYPWLLSISGRGYDLRELIDLEMKRTAPKSNATLSHKGLL